MSVAIGVLLLSLVFSCKLSRYDRARRQLCECLSGIREPADEFSTKWNQKVRKCQSRVNTEIENYELVPEGFASVRPKFWRKKVRSDKNRTGQLHG